MIQGIVLLVMLLALGGCGIGEAGTREAANHAGKLAARVNGTEISVQQVSGARQGAPAQLLERVIDRELLVQQALEAKLDSDPKVVQAMEDARRQVLAQAWLERAAAKVKTTPEEVSAFYAANPALFAQRRIYRLRELGVTIAPDQIEQVRAEAANSRDLDEVSGWLKWRGLKVGPVTGATQAAEQLPLGYLPTLSRMREGEIAVFPSALGAVVVQLVQAQDEPLGEEQAAPLIAQFLAGRQKLELAEAEAKRLRAAAHIEYVGDFKRQ